MARRSTIGANPLDAVVPLRRPVVAAATGGEVPEPKKATKERATFQLPVELIDRARNAVYWTPGATMAGVMEMALEAQLERMEKKRGAPFPERDGALKSGRPVK